MDRTRIREILAYLYMMAIIILALVLLMKSNG
jgi:hypothetical protein